MDDTPSGSHFKCAYVNLSTNIGVVYHVNSVINVQFWKNQIRLES